jgi:hypothetical protein
MTGMTDSKHDETQLVQEIAGDIDRELSENAGAAIAVDPDIAEFMGAFEENALSEEEAEEAAFDVAVPDEFEPDNGEL